MAQDYKDIGLNNQLQSLDSIPTKREQLIVEAEFTATHERDTIPASQIKSLINTAGGSLGIFSTNKLKWGSKGSVNSTTTSTTSTSLVDMPDCTIDAFILTNRANIYTFASCELRFESTDTGIIGLEVYTFIGGDVNDVQEVRMRMAGDYMESGGADQLLTLSSQNIRGITAITPPTSYTIKLRWLALTALDTAYARNRQVYYLLFE